jgi:hypothetical protein
MDRERAPEVVFGTLNLVSAAVLGVGVFLGLPDRYWPVDGGAALLILLLASGGAGLLARTGWGHLVAEIACGVTLGLGLFFILLLSLSASYLAGVYGPVGRGGAVIFILVLALAVPYLVALPGAELLWLRRRRRGRQR